MPVNIFRKKPFPNLREFPYDVRRWCIELQDRIGFYTSQLESMLNLSVSGRWVSKSTWTPVLTQVGTLTCSVQDNHYAVSNGWCNFVFMITVTSGTGTAANQALVTLPVPHGITNSGNRFGSFLFSDASVAANRREGQILVVASDNTRMRFGSFTDDAGAAGGVVGSTDPNVALTTSDILMGWGGYPVANT